MTPNDPRTPDDLTRDADGDEPERFESWEDIASDEAGVPRWGEL